VKRPHLLAVDAPAATFSELFAAARAAGLRLGWLESADPAPATPSPADAPTMAGAGSLEHAAAAGALRAVAVAPGRTLALKPLAGPPVLRDLLREHFQGCAAVLVQGSLAPSDAPRLTAPSADTWHLTTPEATPHHLTTEALLTQLRKPRLG
jgi:hypothetical protein